VGGGAVDAGVLRRFYPLARREVVALAELTPGYVLMGFTKTGGRTFVYQIALTNREAGSITVPHQTVYRECVGVQENATALLAQTSIANVDAVASSYFWDEAAGILYVHSTTGSSPDTFTSYMALVTFRFASTGIVLLRTDPTDSTAVHYAPWLSGGYARILQQMSDALRGILITPTAELTFTNGNGWWHTIVARDGKYVWKNKSIAILVGGSYNGLTLTRSQYSAWSTLQVESVASDEETATFTVKPVTRATEQELPITPMFESDYPNLGDGVRGTKKWIGYGRASIAPDLIDKSGNGVYLCADAAYQTLFAVNAVTAINRSTRARTTLAVTTDYTFNLTTCTVTIVNVTYAWTAYDLEVDVTGKPGHAGFGYIKTYADIVKDILTTFIGVPGSQIDTAAFAQAALDAPQELAVWIKSPRQIASIFDGAEAQLPSLGKSVMGTVLTSLGGLWTCFIWKPGADVSTSLSLRKEDFAKFSAQPRLATIYSSTRVYYGQNFAQDTWQSQLQTDTKTQYQTASTDTNEMYSYLTSSSDALVLAQRFQLISGAVSLEIEFEERGALLATAKAGDKVLVTYSPAPVAAGAFDAYPMELLRVDRSLLPVLAMAGRLGDLRGIAGKIGRWQDVGAPNWSAASPTQRAVSGFWADSNGFIDPADAATKTSRIWW
jgi:hypothetical protein